MCEFEEMLGLKTALKNIENAVAKRSKDLPQIHPCLVAVSKIQPVDLIVKVYEAGQRHFGENYANELNEKANNVLILERCKEIKWHYIGHLQTNKINKVLSSPGIYMVESVDSDKLADNLNKQWPKFCKADERLKVMVQVNTSGEDVKNGLPPQEAPKLVDHIMKNCPNLNFKGLMTIGKYGYDPSEGPNPDFLTLIKCREDVCASLNLDVNNIELSMGMSTDYEQAVELGATTVRVGTLIFGSRPAKNK